MYNDNEEINPSLISMFLERHYLLSTALLELENVRFLSSDFNWKIYFKNWSILLTFKDLFYDIKLSIHVLITY